MSRRFQVKGGNIFILIIDGVVQKYSFEGHVMVCVINCVYN